MNINDLAIEISRKYRDNLTELGLVASREWVNFSHTITINDQYYEIYFMIPTYAKYHEEGVEGTEVSNNRKYRYKNEYVGRKMVDAIRKWIEIKPLVPRPDKVTGRIPTKDEMAWAISKSIKRKGLPALHPLQDAIYDSVPAIDKFVTDLSGALVDKLFDEL